MSKKLLYILLGVTGIAGVYFYIKSKKNEGDTNDPISSIIVSDTSEGEVIEINDGENSSTIVTTGTGFDFSNSGLSPDTVTTETTSEGTITTTVSGSGTTVTTETGTGVITEEITNEGFVDEPYTRQEVEALYAATNNKHGHTFWIFVDNYFTGEYSSGNLGFLGRAMTALNGDTYYTKPPFYVGQTAYVRQFDTENPKYMDYNGPVQIDGIIQGENGQWLIDTTRGRLGDTPVNGGLISKDASILDVTYVAGLN